MGVFLTVLPLLIIADGHFQDPANLALITNPQQINLHPFFFIIILLIIFIIFTILIIIIITPPPLPITTTQL